MTPIAGVGKKSTSFSPDTINKGSGGSTDANQTRGILVRGRSLMDILRNKNTPGNTASNKKKSKTGKTKEKTKEKQSEPAADIRRFLISTEKPTSINNLIIRAQLGIKLNNIRRW